MAHDPTPDSVSDHDIDNVTLGVHRVDDPVFNENTKFDFSLTNFRERLIDTDADESETLVSCTRTTRPHNPAG